MKLGKAQIAFIAVGIGLPLVYFYSREKFYSLQRSQAKTSMLKEKEKKNE
jgi:hypothetical protein